MNKLGCLLPDSFSNEVSAIEKPTTNGVEYKKAIFESKTETMRNQDLRDKSSNIKDIINILDNRRES